MSYLGGHKKKPKDVFGLIPAAGKASRIAPLAFSKELYPIGFRSVKEGGLRPKAVCCHLLENMRLANITKAYIVLRNGKWDIPAYLGNGNLVDMHLGYLMMDLPYGVPFTLDQAYPFVQDALVALGFPDIIFQPKDAFVHLLSRQAEYGADIVLGLFPAEKSHKMDMVELDANGGIKGIQIKPSRTQLRYTWIIAVWSPVFTEFMHDYVTTFKKSSRRDIDGTINENQKEVHISEVVQKALEHKIRTDSVVFSKGKCLDIGTPEDLATAVRIFNCP